MVKLIVIARCIPEDVYLRALEQTSPVLAGEKKFSLAIHEPELWAIGTLAVQITNKYQSIYKRYVHAESRIVASFLTCYVGSLDK